MKQQFMKEKKIFPLVLSMSLPMVLSMLVNSLYNIVDSYFIARVSESAMTALSLVYPIQIIITAISVGLGIGVNAMISYFLGANDSENANITTSWGNCTKHCSRPCPDRCMYSDHATFSCNVYEK